jgi:hypothetical protein
MVNVETHELVTNSLETLIGGWYPVRFFLGKPPLSTVRLQTDRSNFINAENDGRVVLLTGEFLDEFLLLFKFRVLALLPGFNRLVADGGFVQNNPEPLDTDGIHDFFLDSLIP